jgi:hypothetical protein
LCVSLIPVAVTIDLISHLLTMSNNHSHAINLARRLSAQNEPDLLRKCTFFVLLTTF